MSLQKWGNDWHEADERLLGLERMRATRNRNGGEGPITLTIQRRTLYWTLRLITDLLEEPGMAESKRALVNMEADYLLAQDAALKDLQRAALLRKHGVPHA